MAKVLTDSEIMKWKREAMLRREMARNPIVFLDVSMGDDLSNRMIFELFKDVSPLAAENFRALCTGEMGKSQKTKKPLCYQGSIFHRVTKGYVAQGGNGSSRDGSGGESIYGGEFTEKNCVRHNKRGLLTTTGTHIRSQFQILFEPNARYDRNCTVFGNLVSGYDVLRSIEDVPVHGPSSTPDIPIIIVDCGELVSKKVLADRVEHEQKWATNSYSSSESSIDRKHRKRRRLVPNDGITEDRPKDHNGQSYQVSELEKNVDIAPANNSMSKRPGTSPHSVIRPNGPTNGSPRHGRSRSPIHAQKRRGAQSQAAPSMEIEGRGFGYSSSPTRSCSPPPVEKPRSHRDHSLSMPRSCFFRSRLAE